MGKISKILTMAAIMFSCPVILAQSYSDNQPFASGYMDPTAMQTLDMVRNPVGSNTNRVRFETSYQRLYNISELSDSRAALSYSTGRFAVGMAASLFGKDDYFQQLGASVFAIGHVSRMSIGSALEYQKVSFGGNYGSLSLIGLNAGLGYAAGHFNLFGVMRNINEPQYNADAVRYPSEGEIGFCYRSGETIGSQIRFLFVKHIIPSAMVGQGLWLADYLQINWQFVFRPARVGFGFRLVRSHFEINYRFSHHPVLGATNYFSLAAF